MTRQRRFLVTASAACFALTLAVGSVAEAQRPWRANMYNPYKNSQRNYSGSYNNNFNVQSAPARQSLSVERIDIGAGDKVTITVDTPLRLGNSVLATVPQGETYDVLKVIGSWVGIAVQKDGEEVRGWVNYRALDEVE